jgi:hypothetical protein
LVVALACLSNFFLSCLAAAQQWDQVVAERMLGPHERQRRSTGARHSQRQKRTGVCMRPRILAVAILLTCSAIASRAGGPAFIAGSGHAPGVEGNPLIWANGTVQYFINQRTRV